MLEPQRPACTPSSNNCAVRVCGNVCAFSGCITPVDASLFAGAPLAVRRASRPSLRQHLVHNNNTCMHVHCVAATPCPRHNKHRQGTAAGALPWQVERILVRRIAQHMSPARTPSGLSGLCHVPHLPTLLPTGCWAAARRRARGWVSRAAHSDLFNHTAICSRPRWCAPRALAAQGCARWTALMFCGCLVGAGWHWCWLALAAMLLQQPAGDCFPPAAWCLRGWASMGQTMFLGLQHMG